MLNEHLLSLEGKMLHSISMSLLVSLKERDDFVINNIFSRYTHDKIGMSVFLDILHAKLPFIVQLEIIEQIRDIFRV
ncbi:hypothetical protein Hanom_Chr06g00560441 [Helianthus anomalus]